MDSKGRVTVWEGARPDALAAARLLHDFNREYDEPTPSPADLADRLVELLEAGGTDVLLATPPGADDHEDGEDSEDGAGDRDVEPVGISVLRFRPSLWSRGQECYLAELYVRPHLRGRGIGRQLLEASMELARDRGADWMDLGTSEDDVAARALYERLGFTNRERGPDGPVMHVYEREL